jgi:divalent metal cation (Fe/Co/Zn/Cd) transporter
MAEPAIGLVTVTRRPAERAAERARLERRARRLAWWGNAWHVVELAVAVAAGVAAGSVALVAFGLDSLIELAAGTVVVWRFTGARLAADDADRRAQRAIAVSFFALAAYVAAASLRDLVVGAHPGVSWVGIGLALVTAPAMPLLAREKARVGRALSSRAAEREGRQNQLCAYLAVALLAGLGANAAFGWWWADPIAALAIAGIAVREGRDSWRGDGCADGCC